MAEAKTVTISAPDFFAKFGAEVIKQNREQFPALYTPGQPTRFDRALGELDRELFPAQAEVAKALARALWDEDRPGAILNGECRTGKTCIAATVAFMAPHPVRALVMCPPHLTLTWAREIFATLPRARVVVMEKPKAYSQADLQDILEMTDEEEKVFRVVPPYEALKTLRVLVRKRWEKKASRPRPMRRKPLVPEFYIIGRETAKMGVPVVPCIAKGAIQVVEKEKEEERRFLIYAYICPSCEGGLVEADTFKWLPKDPPLFKEGIRASRPEVPGRVKNEKALLSWLGQQVCPICGEPLFTVSPGAKGERWYKASPADLIHRHFKRNYFDLFIADEAHELKGLSVQGEAFAKLAASCRKVLVLTGTLTGGYAEDLYYILWRAFWGEMVRRGFLYRTSAGWSEVYGAVQTVTRYKTREDGSRKGKTVTKVVPGISPKVTEVLYPYTVVLRLDDVMEGLAGQKDFLVTVPLDEPLKKIQTKALEGGAMAVQTARKLGRVSNRYCRGLIHLALAGVDNPEIDGVVNVMKEDEEGNIVYEPVTIYTALDYPNPTPKEEALIEILDKEIDEGRRVLVYAEYTGEKQVDKRLLKILTQAGFKAVILGNVSTKKREGWIRARVREGVQVLITNPDKVKTGLDLAEFPTVVFYEPSFKVLTLRQAMDRPKGPRQTQEVRVYWMAMGEFQETALAKVATKLSEALLAEGDTRDMELFSISDSDNDIIRELVRVMEEGGFVDVRKTWERVNAKEVARTLSLREV